MSNQIFTGALLDTRTEEEVKKDFLFEEIVSSPAPVSWRGKTQEELRIFPVINQSSSSSCVAQTIRKMALIHNWLNEQSILDFSATSIYTHRANKPSGGMIGVDAFNIWRKRGIALEALVPSNNMTEQAMDSLKIEPHEEAIAEHFAISGFLQPPTRDIEAIASIIQHTKKPVMVWYYFTHAEYSKLVPEIQDTSLELRGGKTSRHSVTAVDFSVLEDGRKALLIEDSAHFGGLARRWITEDFHNERNFFAAYTMNFKYGEGDAWLPSPVPSKPKTVRFGDRGDDVVALQRRLQQLGVFPSNVTTTGYFGAITLRAVKEFQSQEGLVEDGIVGPKTWAELRNGLYD